MAQLSACKAAIKDFYGLSILFSEEPLSEARDETLINYD